MSDVNNDLLVEKISKSEYYNKHKLSTEKSDFSSFRSVDRKNFLPDTGYRMMDMSLHAFNLAAKSVNELIKISQSGIMNKETINKNLTSLLLALQNTESVHIPLKSIAYKHHAHSNRVRANMY